MTLDHTDITQPRRPLTFPSTPSQRTITAIVERHPPAALEDVPYARTPRLTITIANDPVTGIPTGETIAAANEFDTAVIGTVDDMLETFGEEIIYHPYGDTLDINKDYVTLAERIGQTPTKRRIAGIISMDAGMLELEVR